MPGDWRVRFLGGPGVERRRAYPTISVVGRGDRQASMRSRNTDDANLPCVGSAAIPHAVASALLSAKNRAASAPNPPRRAPCIAGLAGKSAARPGSRGLRGARALSRRHGPEPDLDVREIRATRDSERSDRKYRGASKGGRARPVRARCVWMRAAGGTASASTRRTRRRRRAGRSAGFRPVQRCLVGRPVSDGEAQGSAAIRATSATNCATPSASGSLQSCSPVRRRIETVWLRLRRSLRG